MRKTPVSRPGGKTYGGDEQADGGEGNGEAGGKRRRAQTVLARRGAENDRQKRQHTWRKNRERPCNKRKSRGCRWASASPYRALVDQRGDRGGIGVADRAVRFGFALIGDQRALRLRFQRAHVVLLRIEIDLEDDEVLVLRLAGQLHQNRILRPADRAPRREDIDQDRLPLLLSRGKGSGVERLPLGGRCRERTEQRGRRHDGKEERAQANHLSDPPIKRVKGAVPRRDRRFEPL